MNCQHIYTGKHGGIKGRICGHPEADHCPEVYGDHNCSPKKVHHPFQRVFHCPTCGCKREGHE